MKLTRRRSMTTIGMNKINEKLAKAEYIINNVADLLEAFRVMVGDIRVNAAYGDDDKLTPEDAILINEAYKVINQFHTELNEVYRKNRTLIMSHRTSGENISTKIRDLFDGR